VISIKLNDILWALPFFCFLSGYFLLSQFLYIPSIETPSLIGKNINYAAQVLSERNLNLRIIAQKEDTDLPDGTIISQIPAKQQKVKPQQSVFCVISCHAQSIQVPNLLKQSTQQVNELIKKEKIKNKSYWLTSRQPENTCIGQIPSAQELLTQQAMTTYFSAGNKKTVLFPSLKNKSVYDVRDFLKKNNIEYTVQHIGQINAHHACDNCFVKDQKPLAGSLVDLSKPLQVQLQVK
jgi:beta-lactam-binding protein with PASTA domain